MLAFILRRLLQSAAVMAVVAFIAFGLFNFTGDPVAFMVGQDATVQDRTRLRAERGLDQPFYVQFGRFVNNAVHGDFGISLRQGRAVKALLRERLPATLELSLVAAVLALVVAIPAGVYTALRRDHWAAQLLLTLSLIGVIQAVNFADIPVMAAYLCFIALVFVLINLAVDLLYYAVDPRLRIGVRTSPAH